MIRKLSKELVTYKLHPMGGPWGDVKLPTPESTMDAVMEMVNTEPGARYVSHVTTETGNPQQRGPITVTLHVYVEVNEKP